MLKMHQNHWRLGRQVHLVYTAQGLIPSALQVLLSYETIYNVFLRVFSAMHCSRRTNCCMAEYFYVD